MRGAHEDAMVFFGATGDLACKTAQQGLVRRSRFDVPVSGAAKGGRVIVEKPFGRDLDSARAPLSDVPQEKK